MLSKLQKSVCRRRQKKRVCCVRNAAVQTSGSNRPSVCLHACLVAYLRRRRRVQQNQFSIVFIYTHTYMLLVCLCVHCVDMRGEGKERKGGSGGNDQSPVGAISLQQQRQQQQQQQNLPRFFQTLPCFSFHLMDEVFSLSPFFFTFQFVH